MSFVADYKIELTPEQLAILNGEKGETLAKVMKTLVMHGDAFEADTLQRRECTCVGE